MLLTLLTLKLFFIHWRFLLSDSDSSVTPFAMFIIFSWNWKGKKNLYYTGNRSKMRKKEANDTI